MAEKERIGKAIATTLHIGDTPIPKMLVGQVTVTGAGTITCPTSASPGVGGIGTIASVQATLGQAPAAGESFVTATWSGLTVTLTVYTSADAVSTTPTIVNYLICGF